MASSLHYGVVQKMGILFTIEEDFSDTFLWRIFRAICFPLCRTHDLEQDSFFGKNIKRDVSALPQTPLK